MKDNSIRNEAIRKKTGIRDIIDEAHCMQGQWAGHLARMNDTQWAKKTTEWTPRDGKQRKERPKKRWKLYIEERCGTSWMQITHERNKWKSLWRLSALPVVTRRADDDE